MSNALKVRLARLERQTQERRWPKVCAGVYDSEADLMGIGDGASNHLERLPGESLAQLAARAFEMFGNVRNLAAQYAPRLAPEPPQRDLPIMAVRDPLKPVELAGIGKIATKDYLESRGFIPIPAERNVD